MNLIPMSKLKNDLSMMSNIIILRCRMMNVSRIRIWRIMQGGNEIIDYL